jgi:hypothetical protein
LSKRCHGSLFAWISLSVARKSEFADRRSRLPRHRRHHPPNGPRDRRLNSTADHADFTDWGAHAAHACWFGVSHKTLWPPRRFILPAPNDLSRRCPLCRSAILLVRRFLPQFALASNIGRQFSDAWFAARQVIDLGRRAAKPAGPPPPPNP